MSHLTWQVRSRQARPGRRSALGLHPRYLTGRWEVPTVLILGSSSALTQTFTELHPIDSGREPGGGSHSGLSAVSLVVSLCMLARLHDDPRHPTKGLREAGCLPGTPTLPQPRCPAPAPPLRVPASALQPLCPSAAESGRAGLGSHRAASAPGGVGPFRLSSGRPHAGV